LAAPDGQLKENYKKCVGWAAQRKFRQEWVNAEWDMYSHTKTATTSFSKKQLHNGTYKALSVLARDEGGDAEGWRAAEKHAAKCIQLGGHFIQWNSFTERAEYLHMSKGFAEEFGDQWAETKTFGPQQSARGSRAALPGRAGTGDASAAAANGGTAGGSAGGAATPPGGGIVTPLPGGNKKRPALTPREVEARKLLKKELDTGCKKLSKVKSQVVVAAQLASELITIVETSDEWSWAKSSLDGVRVPLAALTSLKSKDPFFMKWLTLDEKDLRAQTPAEDTTRYYYHYYYF